MNLILRVKTQSPDIRFSFLRIKLVSGKIVVLTWSDSSIGRSKEGFQAVYWGIRFDQENAGNRVDELKGMQIVDVGAYSPSDNLSDLTVEEMLFVDCEKELFFQSPIYEWKEVAKNAG